MLSTPWLSRGGQGLGGQSSQANSSVQESLSPLKAALPTRTPRTQPDLYAHSLPIRFDSPCASCPPEQKILDPGGKSSCRPVPHRALKALGARGCLAMRLEEGRTQESPGALKRAPMTKNALDAKSFPALSGQHTTPSSGLSFRSDSPKLEPWEAAQCVKSKPSLLRVRKRGPKVTQCAAARQAPEPGSRSQLRALPRKPYLRSS